MLNSLAPMVIDSISPSPADLVVEDLAPDALLDQARVEIRREKSGRAGAAVESRGWLLGQPRRAYGSTAGAPLSALRKSTSIGWNVTFRNLSAASLALASFLCLTSQ